MANSPFLPTARFLALVASLVVCAPATAQLPLVPGLGGTAQSTSPGKTAAASSASADEKLESEVRARLDEERQRLARLDAPGGLRAGAPPGTDEQELRGRRIRAVFAVRTLEQQLADLGELAEARARRKALEHLLQSWTGLPDKPPYSILLADRLRTEYQAAETRLQGLNSREELLRQTASSARDDIKTFKTRLRQLNDRAERARSDTSEEQIAWNRDQTSSRLRMAETLASATETSQNLLNKQEAVAQLELDLARRKLQAVGNAVQFSPEDLTEIRSALATEAENLGRERDRLTREMAQQEEAVGVARRALANIQATPDAGDPVQAAHRLRALQQDLELKQAEVEATASRLNFLRQVADFNRARETLWESRFETHQRRDAASRLTIREGASKLIEYLELQKKLLQQQSKDIINAIVDLETREEQGDSAGRAHLEALKETYTGRAASNQRALAALDSTAALAQQIIIEFGGGPGARSLSERSEEWFALAQHYATAFWNIELLAVEDSIEVDGNIIAGTRSITVGKVLSAILMIVAGYGLAVSLARMGERQLVRRVGWQPAHAAIVGRWMLVVEFALIFIFVLAWVKIPITVFAFLGGAVAIGLGFGMQTLLKNLISGLMILGERPYRLGDIIEVDGIRGTVANIGLRASTISDVNGIETIIPNSSFIEQNLTNWTHSNGQVRFNVKVGVAYGSPVRTVIQALGEVAARHGQVLKDPPPEVLFEDFGSDALIFALHYWLDIGSGTAARRVASDLRCMVESAFADHGIVMAFPQRDVHLDATGPLAVRIVGDAEADGSLSPTGPTKAPPASSAPPNRTA